MEAIHAESGRSCSAADWRPIAVAAVAFVAGAAAGVAFFRRTTSSSAPNAGALVPEPRPALRLIGEILLGDIKGRMDHFAIDENRKLLFVSCLGDDCVLVVDVYASIVLQKLRKLRRPHGLCYVPAVGLLGVTCETNAGLGRVAFFEDRSRGSYHPASRLQTDGRLRGAYCEADNLRLVGDVGTQGGEEGDASSGTILLGHGEGTIGKIVLNFTVRQGGHVHCRQARLLDDDDESFQLEAHPESFQLEPTQPDGSGGRLFVNVADNCLVRVFSASISTAEGEVWPLPDGHSMNFAMALDAEGGHLFVITRRPARVVVYATASGAVVANLPCAGDADDAWWDAKRKRLYVTGGDGTITVVEEQRIRGTFVVLGSAVASGIGARTSIWYPSRDRLYVAAPAAANLGARLLVYEPCS